MLNPVLQKNDKQAGIIIGIVSFVVFTAVVILGRVKLEVELGFDKHIFAKINAVINSVVALLLVAALIAVKKKNYETHKKIMLTAMVLSVLFLVSYICHHLFTGESRFGDINHDGFLNDDERTAAGSIRMVYYAILGTHIFLAGIILPFILFTAYRALIAEWPAHKKIARITWPIWLYVAVTGVVVYFLISPYYQ
jgi:putative membrane protein